MNHSTIALAAAALLAATALTACTDADDELQSEPAATDEATAESEPIEQETTEDQSEDETEGPAPDESLADDTSEDEAEEPGSDAMSPEDGPDPTDLSDFDLDREMSQDWPGSASEPVYLTEIRSAAHGDVERIVFEHTGSPSPQFLVEYTDEAYVANGTGEQADVSGGIFLAVSVSGVMPPEDLDQVYFGHWDPDTPGTILLDVFAQRPFEAHATYYIGLNDEREFRVTALEDPARVVVDIHRVPIEGG